MLRCYDMQCSHKYQIFLVFEKTENKLCNRSLSGTNSHVTDL